MTAVTESQDVQPLRVGTVLDGRYRIDAVLGSGAMGCVYRGEHLGIGRTVAIKVLRSDLGRSHDATQRFKREALASGRLEHPNIVGVSDFGVLEDGSSFLVMEALAGESLGDRLEREQRIPWREAVELMREILRGLHHAHQRGVVHRDIKPDNIFLTSQDGRGGVKLLDFGIAKLVAGTAEDPASTRTGMTIGTPTYLSPEQAVGGEITPATDLYSATVVLFEMLAGRAPFEEADLVATMIAHISKQPPALADVAPEIGFPPQLEVIVQRGLQKLPGDRIASAREYLEMLDAIEAPVPRVSARVSAPYEVALIDTSPALSVWQPQERVSGVLQSQSMDVAVSSDALPTRRTTSVADITEPVPRAWLVAAAVALGGTIVIAIVIAMVSGDSGEPTPKAATRAHATMHDAGAVDASPSISPPITPPVTPDTKRDREVELKALLHDLATGRTCAARRAVIPKLVELDDPKAIRALKSARYRMRGGVLGIGASNTNACLKKDADAAIKVLGRPR